uniref:Transcription initiation factor TFIID subunit 4-like n=1 Tax=Fundulus heteroclitus TaxID=8078 RepID=A0A3Q2NZN1_FUNHE
MHAILLKFLMSCSFFSRLFNSMCLCSREDDDINDVAFMAGVNLGEENARIMTTMVGSVVQSCQDQLFLSPHPLLSRILQKGLALGITEVGPEVVAVVSHATQERLRKLMEKLTMMAQHRKVFLTEDQWHVKVSDVRPQLRFLEETEILRKKRKDALERERFLRLAKVNGFKYLFCSFKLRIFFGKTLSCQKLFLGRKLSQIPHTGIKEQM